MKDVPKSTALGICDYHLYGRERPHPREESCLNWQEVVMVGKIATLTPKGEAVQ